METRKPYSRQRRSAGWYLKHSHLYTYDTTAADLASKLDVSAEAVNQTISGELAITRDISIRLGNALETSTELWLNLQESNRSNNYE